MSSDIVFRSAIELSAALRSRELSAREVTEAHLEQIERVNPAVNAVVTLVAERALDEADAADARIATQRRSVPCTGCPSCTRTPTRPPASAPRTARSCSRTTCPSTT